MVLAVGTWCLCSGVQSTHPLIVSLAGQSRKVEACRLRSAFSYDLVLKEGRKVVMAGTSLASIAGRQLTAGMRLVKPSAAMRECGFVSGVKRSWAAGVAMSFTSCLVS